MPFQATRSSSKAVVAALFVAYCIAWEASHEASAAQEQHRQVQQRVTSEEYTDGRQCCCKASAPACRCTALLAFLQFHKPRSHDRHQTLWRA